VIIATTEHRSGASVGIAMYPEHGLARDELLRRADIALYESKREGRGRATVFHQALDTRVRERGDLLSGLVRALERGEFVVHYQPRLDAATGAVVAAEALVRWQHPERGLTLPGVFIDLAESSGLIDALGLVVMEAAIVQLADWRREGVAIGRVSVNVSQHQFASGQLVPSVRALLLRHGVGGARLEIEVTESVLGGDIDSVRRQLHELRDLGALVAMDDFGTGYSSLSQLRTLPIDVMKVDRAFVKDLETDSNAVAIARTIVTLARALGLQIVAEGIETPAQAVLLTDMGCDQFQGFLYSQAVPAPACAALGPFAVPARAR
jgi:predicted signal transduction protein with EAL and GGDEF domain